MLDAERVRARERGDPGDDLPRAADADHGGASATSTWPVGAWTGSSIERLPRAADGGARRDRAALAADRRPGRGEPGRPADADAGADRRPARCSAGLCLGRPMAAEKRSRRWSARTTTACRGQSPMPTRCWQCSGTCSRTRSATPRRVGGSRRAAGSTTGWAWFSVTDTGIGMTPEVGARIFERFYRAPDAQARRAARPRAGAVDRAAAGAGARRSPRGGEPARDRGARSGSGSRATARRAERESGVSGGRAT